MQMLLLPKENTINFFIIQILGISDLLITGEEFFYISDYLISEIKTDNFWSLRFLLFWQS